MVLLDPMAGESVRPATRTPPKTRPVPGCVPRQAFVESGASAVVSPFSGASGALARVAVVGFDDAFETDEVLLFA